ncbi:cytochrome c [Paraburkholderia acidisoli]|uniref:C-type cytochrome n=1 Tax=Paraburkholderia acidisoli TaxID=2571748 RepID=A0A7Z2GSC1_9BURK|nr:cytochrome c [Paraburkholderia acidisoli]QGZ67048.1 c-type cytochrome [Paraburkholderia acidisoli]
MKKIKPPFALPLLLMVCAAGLLSGCQRESGSEIPTGVHADSALASAPSLIARGEYLAKAGDCAACHDAADHTPFAGGMPVNSPFGPIYAGNITPDRTFGIGSYSLRQFADVLRSGKRPDGTRLYPAMPYPSFAKLNDGDLTALYAYFMHGVKPSRNRTPETRLPFPFNQRWAMFFWSRLFGNDERYVPDPHHSAEWNRGAYLVEGLGHCGACHTPRGPAYNELGYKFESAHYLSGGLNDNWFAPNLTSDPGSGLGRWSQDDIAAFLRDGHGARATAFGAMAPVVGDSTQYLGDDDLHAIAVFLKSLPPRDVSGTFDNNLDARMLTARAVESAELERPGAGIYLSYCARCHRADGTGQPDKAPALAGNPLVISSDPTSVIRIVVEGSESPKMNDNAQTQKMPAFAGQLTTTEMAEVVSFIRNTWGNHATPLSDRDVRQLRAAIHK